MQSTEHNNHIRCQSCGMPLTEEFYGTNADGTKNDEYCKFCFENGAFLEPNLKMEEMIRKCVQFIRESDLKIEEEQAEVWANATIPSLKRWRG